MLAELALPLGDSLLADHALHVLLEGHRELGLFAVQLDHLLDRLEVGERRIEGLGRDVALGGLGPEIGDPGRQFLGLGQLGQGQAGRGQRDQSQRDSREFHGLISC